MSIFFPKWLHTRIVALIHSTTDEQLLDLTRYADDFGERIDRLERMEKLASDRLNAMDTAITGLRAAVQDIDVLQTRCNGFADYLGGLQTSLSETKNDAVEELKAVRRLINGEIDNRSGAINGLKQDLQKDIDRLDSLFRRVTEAAEQPKSARGPKLHKRTS